ncbi:DUF742 domain-containing protein [Actinomadura darangshiensis]|uniref:DUF742 domain-containing protein n=1 Tax=Actinomadura darangshiensis TaxID=705336 RepID=A0A4R4ZR14_9ACTN|nr:DUF742 domain-containing protein [Actinomadura darangshiensis]TDD60800.1 DUF742 domain-containing protein [Actinomadura darangshiensis]
MTGPGSEWLDDEAGPIVRSYALTRGRARPATAEGFDMITIVSTAGQPRSGSPGIGPEHVDILEMCLNPLTVAEISARMRLPLVVVRVLLGDLLHHRLITAHRPQQESALSKERLLREVLHGLQAL